MTEGTADRGAAASAADEVPIRPAATVILLRDGDAGLETLLVRRAAQLAFHGGSWVFPGGRIDDEDHSGDGDADAAARTAAAREAREEADLVVDPSSLRAFAHWTTPPGRNRRFATWFFVAAAPEAHDVTTDGAEIEDHHWFSPADALAARSSGRIELPAPTFVSLTRLSVCATVADALAQTESYPYLRFNPRPARVEGGVVSIYDGDVAYDEPSRLGEPAPRHRLWMLDHDWRYERSGFVGR